MSRPAISARAWVLLSTIVGCTGTQSNPTGVRLPDGDLLVHDTEGVQGIIELESGLLVYTEAYSYTVTFSSPSLADSRVFGGRGHGPGEFPTRPEGLVSLGGDTVGVPYQAGRYLARFTPDGFVDAVPLPIGPGSLGYTLRSDNQGWLYILREGSVFTNGKWLSKPDLEAPTTVYRFRVSAAIPESVWAVGAAPMIRVEDRDRNLVSTVVKPFAPWTYFDVSPEGEFWAAASDSQRVGFRRLDGTEVWGESWGISKIAVPARARREATRNRIHPDVELTVAEFIPSALAAIADRKSRLWVQVYDGGSGYTPFIVFDTLGNKIAHVNLPARAKVIGFGTYNLYYTLTSEDGTENLFRVPDFASALSGEF